MTRWCETGLHSFFKTSQHKTGAHPFYIGMYIHIYTHIYVHIYTSQKECLHIFHIHADETADACCMLMNIWPLYRVC